MAKNWYKLSQGADYPENNFIAPDIAEDEDVGLETVTQEYMEEKQQVKEELDKNEDQNIDEPEEYPEFTNIFQALNWAKTNKQTLRINYRTIKGHNIIRDIEPHGDFFASTTNRRNVVVWDDTIGDIRSYIIDNILPSGSFPKGYKFTGEKFSPKFNFSQRRKTLRRP